MLFFDDSGDDQITDYDNFVPQKQWLNIHANLWAEHFIRPIKTRNKAMTSAFNREYLRIKGLYTFLEETQILGKTYNKFFIPNICGKIPKSFLKKHVTSKRYQKKIGNFNLKASGLVHRTDLSSRNTNKDVKKPLKFFTSKLNKKRIDENEFDFDQDEEFRKSKATYENKNKMINSLQNTIVKSNPFLKSRKSILKEKNDHLLQEQFLVFKNTDKLEGENLAKYNNPLQPLDIKERHTEINELNNLPRVKKNVHFKDSKLCSFEPSQESLRGTVQNSENIIPTETEMLFDQFLQISKLEEYKKNNVNEKSSYETLLENNTSKNLNHVNNSAYQEIEIDPPTNPSSVNCIPTPAILIKKKTNKYTHKPLHIDITKQNEIEMNDNTNERPVDRNASFNDRFAHSPAFSYTCSTENISDTKDQTENDDINFEKTNKSGNEMPITFTETNTLGLLNIGDTEILVNEKHHIIESFENDIGYDSNSSGRVYEDDLFSQHSQNLSSFTTSPRKSDISILRNNEKGKETENHNNKLIEVNQITDDTLKENNDKFQRLSMNASIFSEVDDTSEVLNEISSTKSYTIGKNNESQNSISDRIDASQTNKLDNLKFNKLPCDNYLTPVSNKESKEVIKAPKKNETQLYGNNSLIKTIQNGETAPIFENGFSLSECNKKTNKISKKKLFELLPDKEYSLNPLKNVDNIEEVIDYNNYSTDLQYLAKQLKSSSNDSSTICETNYEKLEKGLEKVTENHLKTVSNHDLFNKDIGFENIKHATPNNTNSSNECTQQYLKGHCNVPGKEIVSESDLCLKNKMEALVNNHKMFLDELELQHSKNKKSITSLLLTSDYESSKYLHNDKEKSSLQRDLLKTDMYSYLVTEFLVNTNSSRAKIDRIENLDLSAESESDLNKGKLTSFCNNYLEVLPLKNIEEQKIYPQSTNQTIENEIQMLSESSPEDPDDFIVVSENYIDLSKQKCLKRKHNLMGKSVSAVGNNKESKMDKNDENVSIQSEFPVSVVQNNTEKNEEITPSNIHFSPLQNIEQKNTNRILRHVHMKKHTDIIISENLHNEPQIEFITNNGNSYESYKKNNSIIHPSTDNSEMSEPGNKINIELVSNGDNIGENYLLNIEGTRIQSNINYYNKITSSINCDFVNNTVNLPKDDVSKTIPTYNKNREKNTKYENVFRSEQLDDSTANLVNSLSQGRPLLLSNQEIQQKKRKSITGSEILNIDLSSQFIDKVSVIDKPVNYSTQINISELSKQEMQQRKHRNIIRSEQLGRKSIDNDGVIDEPVNSLLQNNPLILSDKEIQQRKYKTMIRSKNLQMDESTSFIHNVDAIDKSVNSTSQNIPSILSDLEIPQRKLKAIIRSEKLSIDQSEQFIDNVDVIDKSVNSPSQNISSILSDLKIQQKKPKAIIRSEKLSIDQSEQFIDNVDVIESVNSPSQNNFTKLSNQEIQQRKPKVVIRSEKLKIDHSEQFIDNVDNIDGTFTFSPQTNISILSRQIKPQKMDKNNITTNLLHIDDRQFIDNVDVIDKSVNSPSQNNPSILSDLKKMQRKPKAVIRSEKLSIDQSEQFIDNVDVIDESFKSPPQTHLSVSSRLDKQEKHKTNKKSGHLQIDSKQFIDNADVGDGPANFPSQNNLTKSSTQEIQQRKSKAVIRSEKLNIDHSKQFIDDVDNIDRTFMSPPQTNISKSSILDKQEKHKANKKSGHLQIDSKQFIDNADVGDGPANSPSQSNHSILSRQEKKHKKHKHILKSEQLVRKSTDHHDSIGVQVDSPIQTTHLILSNRSVDSSLQTNFSILSRQEIQQRKHKNIVKSEQLGRKSIDYVDSTGRQVDSPLQTNSSILSRQQLQQRKHKNIIRSEQLHIDKNRQFIDNVDIIDLDPNDSPSKNYPSMFIRKEVQQKTPKTVVRSEQLHIDKNRQSIDNVDVIDDINNSPSKNYPSMFIRKEVQQKTPKTVVRSEQLHIDKNRQSIDNVDDIDDLNNSPSKNYPSMFIRKEVQQKTPKTVVRSEQLHIDKNRQSIDNVDVIDDINNSPSKNYPSMFIRKEVQQKTPKTVIRSEHLHIDKNRQSIDNVDVIDDINNSPSKNYPSMFIRKEVQQKTPKTVIRFEQLHIDKNRQSIDNVDVIDDINNSPSKNYPSMFIRKEVQQKTPKTVIRSEQLHIDKNRQFIDNVDVIDNLNNSPSKNYPSMFIRKEVQQKTPKTVIRSEQLHIDKNRQFIDNVDVIDNLNNSPSNNYPSILIRKEVQEKIPKTVIRSRQLYIDRNRQIIDNVNINRQILDNVNVINEPVNSPAQTNFSVSRQEIQQRKPNNVIRHQQLDIDKSKQSTNNVDGFARLVYPLAQTNPLIVSSQGKQKKHPKVIIRFEQSGDYNNTESINNSYDFCKLETQKGKSRTLQSEPRMEKSSKLFHNIEKENDFVDVTVSSGLKKKIQNNIIKSEYLHKDQIQSMTKTLNTSNLPSQIEEHKLIDHDSKYKRGDNIMDESNLIDLNFEIHEDSYLTVNKKHSKNISSTNFTDTDNIVPFNPNKPEDNISNYSEHHLNLGKSKHLSQQTMQKPKNQIYPDNSSSSSNKIIIPTQKTHSPPFRIINYSTSKLLKPNVNLTKPKKIQTCEDLGETNSTVSSPMKTMHDKLANNSYVIYSYDSSQTSQKKSFQPGAEDLSSMHSKENNSASDNDYNCNLLSANIFKGNNLLSMSSEDGSVDQNIANGVWSDSVSKTSSTGAGFGFDYDLPSYGEGSLRDNTSISSPIMTDDDGDYDPWLSP